MEDALDAGLVAGETVELGGQLGVVIGQSDFRGAARGVVGVLGPIDRSVGRDKTTVELTSFARRFW